MRWFVPLSPASKIVVLFASLNVALVLLFTLTVPPFARRGAQAPFSDPWAVLVRAGLAALVVLAVLRCVDLVRPAWRSFGISVAVLTLATALLTLYYTPILALAYLPLVFRVRTSLTRAAVASVLMMAPLLLISFGGRGAALLDLGRPSLGGLGLGRSPPDVLTLTVAAGALGAYLLLTFELALREARSRQEITASHREVSRYRDLEVSRASVEERARISRELHDTLGHHLTAQRFDLQLLSEDAAALTGAQAAAVARALDRNAEALTDLRRAVDTLQPDTLQPDVLRAPAGADGDLRLALQRLVRVWAPSAQVPSAQVTLHLEDVSADLSGAGKLAVYRAAQEALTNAGKHAPGQAIALCLRAEPGGVRFEATNVCALPPSAHERGHAEGRGVRGLRERAAQLGGDAGLSFGKGQVRLWLTLPSRIRP